MYFTLLLIIVCSLSFVIYLRKRKKAVSPPTMNDESEMDKHTCYQLIQKSKAELPKDPINKQLSAEDLEFLQQRWEQLDDLEYAATLSSKQLQEQYEEITSRIAAIKQRDLDFTKQCASLKERIHHSLLAMEKIYASNTITPRNLTEEGYTLSNFHYKFQEASAKEKIALKEEYEKRLKTFNHNRILFTTLHSELSKDLGPESKEKSRKKEEIYFLIQKGHLDDARKLWDNINPKERTYTKNR